MQLVVSYTLRDLVGTWVRQVFSQVRGSWKGSEYVTPKFPLWHMDSHFELKATEDKQMQKEALSGSGHF